MHVTSESAFEKTKNGGKYIRLQFVFVWKEMSKASNITAILFLNFAKFEK